MNIRNVMPLLAVSLAALGCTKTLDLDAPAVEPSTEPGVLGTTHGTVDQIIVDEERLYWIGHSETPGWTFVQSCQKQDCAATLVTYDAYKDQLGDSFSVRGGQVYWYRWPELVACPISGCRGSPRSVVSKLEAFISGAFDDDRFYFSDPSDQKDVDLAQYSLFSAPLTAPGPRQVVASLPFFLSPKVVDDIYAYGLTSGDRNYSGLFRARKDGSSAAEVITKDVKKSGGQFSVVTDPTAIYWTNNVLAGSINRCPLAGCSGASEVVIGPLRAPQKLLIDGSELYYVYERQPYEYVLAVCSLPACAKSLQLFEKLVSPGAFAIDDQYLYLATSELDLSNFTGDFSSQIRRLAKPNRGLP